MEARFGRWKENYIIKNKSTEHQSRHEVYDRKPEEIRKEYERYYADLIKVQNSEDIYETVAEKSAEETFHKIIRDAQKDKSKK